jgi:hypothetical protein
MALSAAQNQVDLAMSHEPKLATPIFEASEKEAMARNSISRSGSGSLNHARDLAEFEADLEGEEPTPEELATLPRVSGKIPWIAFTVGFVELCERFGYYGCSVVCMSLCPFLQSNANTSQTPTTSSIHYHQDNRPAETPPKKDSLVHLAWASEPQRVSFSSTSSGPT